MELIDREQAIKYATKAHISGCVADRIEQQLRAVPTIESRPKGKWVEEGGAYFTCSECAIMITADIDEYIPRPTWRYCPNCGAEMRSEEE